jgi:hypothetical protein
MPMNMDSHCSKCPVRMSATDFLLSSIRLRRGMSLQDARTLLLARYSFTYGQTERLITELRQSKMIGGNAKKFIIPSQKGGDSLG